MAAVVRAFSPSFTLPLLGIIRREFLSSLRRSRTFFIMALFVGGSMMLTLIAWPEGPNAFYQAADFSEAFLFVLASILFITGTFLVPAIAANSITLEREQDTLDLLRMTLVPSRGIIFAKLLNCVGIFILLCIGSLPVLGASFFLVGIDWVTLMRCVAVIMVTAVTCGLFGIAMSARSRRGMVAIVKSYLLIFLILWFGPGVLAGCWWVISQIIGIFGVYIDGNMLIRVIVPTGTLAAILQGLIGPWEFAIAIAFQCGIAGLCFRMAAYSLRYAAEPKRVETRKTITDPALLRARRRSFPFYLIDPLSAKKPIKDGRNPLSMRETRWGRAQRNTILARMFCGSAVLFFFLNLPTYMERNIAPFMIGQTILAILVAPLILANGFTRERELGNLDMLRLTLLAPRDMITGKLGVGWLFLSPIIVAGVLWTIFTLPFAGLHQWPLVAGGYITMGISCWLCLALSLVASLATRRTTTAIVLSYFLCFMAMIGAMLLLEFFISFYWYPYFAYAYESTRGKPVLSFDHSAFASPVVMFIRNIEWHRRQSDAFNLLNPRWVCAMGVYLLLAGLLTKRCINVFQRFHMRDR